LNTSRNGSRGEHRWMPILQRGCCQSAHVSRSHRSNSRWRNRPAISMVIYVMVATVTATSRKAG
jgi:hypothetical protein